MNFKKDCIAGITVGIIALPLAMAFAIASGVDPVRGLYTAIIAGFLISLLGGSRVQIGGPTGAFVVIIYDIMQKTGYEGLCLSTLIAAALLILMGVFKIGSLIKYVPHSLVTGFTTGIALIIFSSQIKDFFGLQMGPSPADFIEKWEAYFHFFKTFQSPTLCLSIGTLGLILIFRKYAPSIPWGISAIVLATFATFIFGIPVETVYSRFGDIPNRLPTPSLPHFTFDISLNTLIQNGFAIAFLGGIESLLSAVIGDGMVGGRHRSNCELIAQGIANFGSILFGGIPATGAIARTATNVKTGAQTPVAGMIHAITLLLILMAFSPLVSMIPLAALSAVLIMVAWNMSEMHHFTKLLKGPSGDRLVLITSFLLTVFVDITIAITVGMILACFVFMKQMSQMSKVVAISDLFEEKGLDLNEKNRQKNIPEGTQIYEIQGPFFFGTANILKDLLQSSGRSPSTFILCLKKVPVIDASGLHAIKEFYDACKKEKIKLYLTDVQMHTRHDLKQFGLQDAIKDPP